MLLAQFTTLDRHQEGVVHALTTELYPTLPRWSLKFGSDFGFARLAIVKHARVLGAQYHQTNCGSFSGE
jgi:hypothetical protein